MNLRVPHPWFLRVGSYSLTSQLFVPLFTSQHSSVTGHHSPPLLPCPHMAFTAQPGLLSSRDNRWLKQFRIALRGGLPTESGSVGVEGLRLVEEALSSGCPIRAVLFSES